MTEPEQRPIPAETAPASKLYGLLRPLLFRLDAERAHDLGIRALAIAQSLPGGLGLLRALHTVDAPRLRTTFCGLALRNPLGVAAGLDKNARVVDGLAALGFGSVEVGTVTPRPQPGNDRPRMFRIPAAGAVVNRLGFNNRGVDAMAARLADRARGLARPASTERVVLGINLGKNKATADADAAADYVAGLRALYAYADYLTVNVSSPNTPGLRALQAPDRLAALLGAVVTAGRAAAASASRSPKPILVKLAPDMTDDLLRQTLDTAAEAGIDGVILTNTTTARDGLPPCAEAEQQGGMSGAPLFARSRHAVAVAHRHLGGRMPIVGVGGVRSGDDAFAMLTAGASVVQLYTGFVYGGPNLPARILRDLDARLDRENVRDVTSVVGADARLDTSRVSASVSGRAAVAWLLIVALLGAGLLWWFGGAKEIEDRVRTADGLLVLPLGIANDTERRFVALDPATSGLAFTNFLRRENTLPYVYNGAGVAVGDYDDDGLPDVYLVSQDGPNKLFRQIEPMRFADVTAAAGVDGGDAWGAGATFVDVDGDGRLDIYVCNTESPNLLYVNQGDGTFREQAREFGLAHIGASTMAAFADFDRDGDLDLYLLTNRVFNATIPKQLLDEVLLPSRVTKTMRQMLPDPLMPVRTETGWAIPPGLEDHLAIQHGQPFYTGQKDLLLRNDGGKFVDVSKPSGIDHHGLGLGVVWFDMDGDGWPDVYVANDLESPDRLYRNNRDGTFTDVAESALPHLAYFGMGVDAADIDNDGRLDVLVADMSSTTHFKSKWLMGEMSNRGWFLEHARPQQYMRNALFLNTGTERFHEIAFLAGVASTDWTWAVKFGDLDNDGFQDLFVTNGIPRFDMDPDLNPRFAQLVRAGREKEAFELARNVPPFPEANIAMRNTGGHAFTKVGPQWGLDLVGVSHGAAFADFDRDGDLDLIVNNQNAPATLYENRLTIPNAALVRLEGRGANRFGVDAKVVVTAGGKTLTRHLTLARGYLSSDDPVLHFGLGSATQIDTLDVYWPSGHRQSFRDLPVRRKFVVTEPDGPATPDVRTEPAPTPRFTTPEVATHGLDFRHVERAFDDFARQPLLPHRLSRLGPGVAVGDVDGDGRDDVFVGGAAGQSGRLFVRGADGTFAVVDGPWQADAACEDMGVLFFDADGDGDLDLYVVSGGVEGDEDAAVFRDRLYVNDGAAKFTPAPPGTLPDVRTSGSCVVAADFDRDGDLDLFVGGRTIPGRFPFAPPSRLLRNDGGRFVDAADLAPALADLGMVSAAVWTDVDDDGWQDLVVAVHFGPIVLLRNDGGRLVDASSAAGLDAATGWWNGIAAGDLDGDGDVDLVVTNFGRNTKYKASPEHPAELFSQDLDGNGTVDVVEAKYQGDELLPVRGRSCSSQAMPFIAEKFPTFQQFAKATLTEIYTQEQLANAKHLRAAHLTTAWLRNDGGRFTLVPMPHLAQAAPGFGVVLHDADADGRLDVVVAQNFFAPEPETGRMAGGLGAWLRNTGDGFALVPARDSGLVIPFDGKGLALCDVDGDGRDDLLYACSDAPLAVRLTRSDDGPPPLRIRLAGAPGNPTAIGARVTVRGSTVRTAEVRAGSGYLSQSTAALTFVGAFTHATVRWPDGATTEHPLTQQNGDVTLRRE